jgi:hypothetical protein
MAMGGCTLVEVFQCVRVVPATVNAQWGTILFFSLWNKAAFAA